MFFFLSLFSSYNFNGIFKKGLYHLKILKFFKKEMSDFTILENTMVKPFATLISCRDTINGECSRGGTLEQCIQECRENPLCACGYYLEPSNPKKKSYCAPLNSILLKNMNLMWNIYDVKTDPTKDLWKRATVFFRPNIYPPTPPDNVILMQRDIMAIYYYSNATKKKYFLQEDLRWLEGGEDIGMKVLFIDKFPQFYELANNIQNKSNFILKIFSRPEVIAIVENKLKKVPYLSVDPTKKIPDTYMYIENATTPNIIQYPIMTFETKFQILTDSTKSFLGLKKNPKPKDKYIELEAIPWNEDPKKFTGYFQVIRKALQPNIYKVSEILPARMTFLENSVLPYKQPSSVMITILLIISLILLVIMIVLYLKKWNK